MLLVDSLGRRQSPWLGWLWSEQVAWCGACEECDCQYLQLEDLGTF